MSGNHFEHQFFCGFFQGISCLFDDCVLELMWGLKNCMHHLVPGEELELAKEDRLQMSKGMKMVLDGYGFDVKPEMVSSLQHLLFHILTWRA
jgi:hypothetical protein